ncbi:hypothetical protein LCGC14_2134540, partial [marine sediment metagenome]
MRKVNRVPVTGAPLPETYEDYVPMAIE